MMMPEKTIFCLSLLFCSLLSFAAEFQELSDEDAGQLIYFFRNRTVLVFRKRGAHNLRQWICSPFRGNGTIAVDPKFCRILNYTEAELSPDAIAVELAYWTYKKDRYRAACYRQIAEKMNANATTDLLDFYAKLNEHADVIAHAAVKYRAGVMKIKKQETRSSRSGCPYGNRNPASVSQDTLDSLEDAFKTALSNTGAAKYIESIIADGEKKNFLLAFCMYIKYRDVSLQALRDVEPKLRREIVNEIDKQGEDIRQKYQQARSDVYNRSRENSFRQLCPDRHGRWEFAPPANMMAMHKFVVSCYTAWCKTRSLSPHSEFPEWGCAMLEVMQMIKNPELESKFDTAYTEYKNNHNN